MRGEILGEILKARDEARALVVATRLADGEQSVVDADPAAPEGTLAHAAHAALMSDKARTVEIAGEDWFLNVFNTPLRLVVVGAVHIAQALVPAAQLAGYLVTVVDPRTAFATADRFPGVAISHDWPDEAMEALKPDHRTALVTLTHDPKLDDPALHVALRAPLFYIGALGSTRTHAKRVARLTEAGFTEAEIARIHAPVGLSISASTPAEIAIATLAQITSVLRGGKVR